MDTKTLATILFRVSGVSYVVYSLFYVPYTLLYAVYYKSFLIAGLAIMTYLAVGGFLFLLSKPLAALIVKGLEVTNFTSPPLPPAFRMDTE